MAKTAETLPLSKLTGGINRFEVEAAEDQAVDALDVWERKGDLQRRPAFRPIAVGPVFPLPSGKVHVKIETLPGSFATYTDKKFTVTASLLGGVTGRLWIGCDEAFDGIMWPNVRVLPTAATANRRAWVRFRRADLALETAYGVSDSTSRRESLTAASRYRQSLQQEGLIHWHRSQFTNWAATTLDGQLAFWIALDLTDTVVLSGLANASAAMSGTGNLQLESPGIRAFVSNPINGLLAVRARGSAPYLIVGADQRQRRAFEQGGNIGWIKHFQSPIEQALLPSREGSAVMGVVTKPAWSHAGAPTGTEGTAAAVTKLDSSYSFNVNELAGAVVATLTALTGSTTTRIVATVPALVGTNREHHRVRFTSGALNGLEREVFASDASGFDVHDAFDSAPANGDTFELRRLPAFARTREGGRLYEIESNNADRLTLTPFARAYQTAQAGADQSYANFEAGPLAPWTLNPGLFWNGTFDPITGQTIVTNGEGRLLTFDGLRLRNLEALFDATDGVPGADLVQQLIASLTDTVLLRTPPTGKYVAEFLGRIVVANLRDAPQRLRWSLPFAANNIWPAGDPFLGPFDADIRDAENGPITGLWALHDQLIVATPTSLHRAAPPGPKQAFNFRPVSQGVGFVSGQAVVVLPGPALLGPSADGIRLFDGSNMNELLDDWARLLPGGVNQRLLYQSVGALWLSENLYFLAVPGAGSTTNNRLIVLDLVGKKFWVWSAPFGGISSIGKDFDDAGREIIYFGHQDGAISVLDFGLSRDGAAAITGRAKSRPQYFGHAAAVPALFLTVQGRGTTSDLTIRSYLNNSDGSRQSFTGAVDLGEAVFGTGLFGTATFASTAFKTFRVNLRAAGVDAAGAQAEGTVGESFQFEIESTSQFIYRAGTMALAPKGYRST